MSFASFWKRNLSFFKLGVLSNLEYRFNYFVDAIVQPILTALIEVALWSALFQSSGKSLVAGFGRESYLSYALWATFTARIVTNWMYEYRMVNEIDSGSVNTVLVRPITFFEVYWSQFFGYKLATTFVSFLIPVIAAQIWALPTLWSHLPLAILMISCYLLFAFLISMCLATTAFFFNRVHSLSAAKNFILWLLTGEFFPLDLIPHPYREWVMKLPFSCGVYLPTGYIIGRVDLEEMYSGFYHLVIGIGVAATLAYLLWSRGIKQYTGTGA